MNNFGFVLAFPLCSLFLGNPITVDSVPFGFPLLAIFGRILISDSVTKIQNEMHWL